MADITARLLVGTETMDREGIVTDVGRQCATSSHTIGECPGVLFLRETEYSLLNSGWRCVKPLA